MGQVLHYESWKEAVIESKMDELRDILEKIKVNRSSELVKKGWATVIFLERYTKFTHYNDLARLLAHPTERALPHKK